MLETILEFILKNALEIVMAIIYLVIAIYVIPYIKRDLIPWLKEKRLYGVVKNFVQAAEKMAESGVITKEYKKSFVVELLENNGFIVDDTVDAIIESCVKELDIITSVVYEEIIEAEEN